VTAVVPGPASCLVREFPAWQIVLRSDGAMMCSAYWQSADGRHRRYIVARTAGDLLQALRERIGAAAAPA
jgi:hypothetical protein